MKDAAVSNSMFPMRCLIRCFVLMVSLNASAIARTIRQVDFANFSFPWVDPHELSDSMQWLKASNSDEVRLVNGRWSEADEPESASNSQKLRFPVWFWNR